MDVTVAVMVVLTGLCLLPSCDPRFFILNITKVTWTNALKYCRSSYTDLAIVQNEQQVAELSKVIGSQPAVWTGLSADIESWRWSLESQSYYGAGEAAFRNWAAGFPQLTLYHLVCVAMVGSGEWKDQLCVGTFPFICYKETPDPSSRFVFVNQNLNWTNAQLYCRLHYTDLASVRNQAENDQMKMMVQTQYTWIGLYRNSWHWSNGSPMTTSNWDPALSSTPTTIGTCVSARNGKWYTCRCTNLNMFACYAEPVVMVVRMVLGKTDAAEDMEDQKDGVLQKFNHSVRGLNGVKLRWVEQPDGKIFQKININNSTAINICLDSIITV